MSLRIRAQHLLAALLWSLAAASPLHAETLNVAVAANFAQAFQGLAQRFEQQSGHKVITSLGSTGKLYTQIRKGAPYDLFLAADSEHPALLEQAGLGELRRTYAVGRLVLWRRQGGAITDGRALLEAGAFRVLAIANPKTAPYGRAAEQALRALGLWDRLEGRLVRGENISQAYQYVASGNAELGLVALSHVIDAQKAGGHYWLLPQDLYRPIAQQAVLLTQSKNQTAARAMMTFLASAEAKALTGAFGYSTAP